MEHGVVARIAAEVRAEMGRRSYTQADAARQLGITKQSASLKMRGRSRWHVEELVHLAHWLDVPLDTFTDLARPAGAEKTAVS